MILNLLPLAVSERELPTVAKSVYERAKEVEASCQWYQNIKRISDHSGNDGEDLGFKVLDGLGLSESKVAFKEVKSMENFNVLVNGLDINSEFSKHLLTKYYDLCCSQNSFLHEFFSRV